MNEFVSHRGFALSSNSIFKRTRVQLNIQTFYTYTIYAKKMKNEEEAKSEGKIAIELEIKLIYLKVLASVPSTAAVVDD